MGYNLYSPCEISPGMTHKMLLNTVIKRDGRAEPGDINKIHKVCEYACEGIDKVSVSELEMEIVPLLKESMTTLEINEAIVAACRTLITRGRFNYDQVGGRINAYIVRKEAYGRFTPPTLLEIVKTNVALRRYDPDIPSFFSEEEWSEIDAMIDHDRDDLFRLAGSQQMRSKYLSRHKVTGKICESFQIPAILVAAVLNRKIEDPVKKMATIKEAYDTISLFDISLPTPQMSGIRTVTKQFASCVLIDCGDSLDSIGATMTSILRYVSNKAGLGVNVGRLRGVGAPIRHGEAVHTGNLPFIKAMTGVVKSCSAGGVRDGAVTFYFPIWHWEAPELFLLKSNTLPEEQTNRRADYGIQTNAYLWQRLINEEEISLFSPYDVPGLYEAFFEEDCTNFARLYEAAEADPSIRRRTFSAFEHFSAFATNRSNGGRLYVSNTDLTNKQSSFQVPVYQSNLCAEVGLPTTPLESPDDPEGEISICTLANINWGKIKTPADFERPCRVAVNLLEEILDYQDYPVPAARISTMYRRPLGIGVMGLAHFLAQRGLKYNAAAAATVDEFAEAWAYYLIRASVDLAKERGPCPGWKETKYAIPGWFPHRARSLELDEYVPFEERLPWDELAEDIQKYGIRHSTLMAIPPGETSSQISNSTNGIEPPRGASVVKGSKETAPPIVVPDVWELKDAYDYAWDQPGPQGYFIVTAFLQKYMDQAISLNATYNPTQYPGETLSVGMLLGDMIFARKLGHKNIYYQNTYKPGEEEILGADDQADTYDLPEVFFEEDLEDCPGGACSI